MDARIGKAIRGIKSRTSGLHFVRVPIVAGPLRGLRWTLASRGKLLRILFGTYEKKQTSLFADLLRENKGANVVFDVGASVGYYTCLAARLAGVVHAFEPSPCNLVHLRNHVRYNRLQNVHIHDMALGSYDGFAQFNSRTGTGTGHISREGDLRVRVCRIDDLVARLDVGPTHLKIDVEGQEIHVLEGARETIRRFRPVIFLSTHGPENHAACQRELADAGYEVVPLLDPGDADGELLFISRRDRPQLLAAG